MECTNPQYIVRATDATYHTEIFAVSPGAAPAIVNQIPPGKPTIPNGTEAEMIARISDVLAKGGFCTIPEPVDAPAVEEVEDTSSESEIPSGLGALSENMARRAQTRAVEEVPATPDIYLQKTESIDTPGSGGSLLATVLAIPIAVAGGKMAIGRVQQQMFPVTVQPEVQNYESTKPENIYHRPQHAPAVSAAPAAASEPSPWTRSAVHAGNPRQAGDFDRNDSPKWTRNESEMSPKRLEMAPEISLVSPEMSEVDSEQLNRVRSRLSGLFRNVETPATQAVSVETKSETSSISSYFDPSGDLSDAKQMYFSLRQQGLSKATDLGGAIFGIRGGDRWASVSPILQSWNNEWEELNGSGIS